MLSDVVTYSGTATHIWALTANCKDKQIRSGQAVDPQHTHLSGSGGRCACEQLQR